MKPPLDIRPGDIVQMRKPHPCGNDVWKVVRIGAEIGIRCVKCERKVLLSRVEFERRMKRFVQRGAADANADS